MASARTAREFFTIVASSVSGSRVALFRCFGLRGTQLGLDHVRDYQVHLFRTRKLKANSVRTYLEALRFVFVAVLKRPWTVLDTPYPKQPKRLPVVLSREEVARLIELPRTRGAASDENPALGVLYGGRKHVSTTASPPAGPD